MAAPSKGSSCPSASMSPARPRRCDPQTSVDRGHCALFRPTASRVRCPAVHSVISDRCVVATGGGSSVNRCAGRSSRASTSWLSSAATQARKLTPNTRCNPSAHLPRSTTPAAIPLIFPRRIPAHAQPWRRLLSPQSTAPTTSSSRARSTRRTWARTGWFSSTRRWARPRTTTSRAWREPAPAPTGPPTARGGVFPGCQALSAAAGAGCDRFTVHALCLLLLAAGGQSWVGLC